MTGSHEVRGSIPLGSTNIFTRLRASIAGAFTFVCLWCANSRCFIAWPDTIPGSAHDHRHSHLPLGEFGYDIFKETFSE
jgi:hypothetical protein